MKGGITSGVVYPRAVCELAETFRFRNIGGTSAGAIAAAAAAAAEYGRGTGGFEQLSELPDWIGSGRNLPSLFQPQRSTRGIFRILMAKIEYGWLRAIAVAILWNVPMVVLGLAPAAVLALFADPGSSIWLLAVTVASVFILAVLGVAVALVAFLGGKLLWAVPRNGFGLCAGWTETFEKDKSGPAPLTPWLYERLNEYASLGDGEPLTFGHLWAGPQGDQASPPENADERLLNLAMMTTNLTNRRAHQLPFAAGQWFFCPDELRKLFPAEVMDWMEAKAGGEVVTGDGERLLKLPAPKDLPVIVATRLSLSFPVLLSAVPLWRREEPPNPGPTAVTPDPERCWFSDGGISSNFPIHFFDRLVPRWPTFAINLRPFRRGEVESEDELKNTWMVSSETEQIGDWWYPIDSLFGFLSGIGHTMQNRVDEAQMRVPGYRDRIAHVSLSDEEGGMNLAMEAETIRRLIKRGGLAAGLLRDAYTRAPLPGTLSWDAHRWVRLRSSLAVLEEMHLRFIDGYGGSVEPEGAPSYADLLSGAAPGAVEDYPWVGPSQQALAVAQIKAIEAAIAGVDDDDSVTGGAPSPPPEGRIGPRG
jgi:predicted acylesterase/phospholipase RssA